MVKYCWSVIFFIFSMLDVYSQAAGHVYQFLENPYNARVEAMGGSILTNPEQDLSLVHQNPALLNSSMEGQLAFNTVFYYAGINSGATNYAFNQKQLGTISLGANYMYYGEFIEANELGVKTGEFYAGDVAFNLTWARQLDSNFTVGFTAKPIFSFLHTYRSVGFGLSGGALYRFDNGLTNLALVVDNLGVQVSKYHAHDPRGPLPLNISLGFTQRLAYAPLRLSVTAQHLEQLDLSYKLPDDENVDPFTGQVIEENKIDRTMDQVLRHLVFGVEFLPSETFYVALGYNYRRRQEMIFSDNPGFVGFSWGLGLNLKRIRISYGRAAYHLSGGTNYISVLINLKQWNSYL
ncbi:MAG: type IX secretion system protein PorQ [Bacteroidetes bacterium]|jgi:hypothetical protein|nr:type IX secretion system protein PorQ [Bacteroidota bacterium]